MKPPKDNSLETFKEIQSINKLRKDEKFVKDHDDIYDVYIAVVGKDEDNEIKDL